MAEEKRRVGRPSKYNETLQAMADDYVINHAELQGDLVPTAAGLCCYIGISRPTLHVWGREYPDFSKTLEAISVKQEQMLINGALGNSYNSTIAKLMLANHGYSDRVQTDHTSSDGSMSPKGKSLDDFYESEGEE